MPRCLSLSAPASVLTKPTTVCPAACNCSPTNEPTYPVAPVRKTFMLDWLILCESVNTKPCFQPIREIEIEPERTYTGIDTTRLRATVQRWQRVSHILKNSPIF